MLPNYHITKNIFIVINSLTIGDPDRKTATFGLFVIYVVEDAVLTSCMSGQKLGKKLIYQVVDNLIGLGTSYF